MSVLSRNISSRDNSKLNASLTLYCLRTINHNYQRRNAKSEQNSRKPTHRMLANLKRMTDLRKVEQQQGGNARQIPGNDET
jgi:hypothetical protein